MVKPFVVENPDALKDAIRMLDNVVSESSLRRAAVAGARVYLDEMRLRVPVAIRAYERKGTEIYPGFLRDNLLIAYDKEVSVSGRLASYIVTWSKDAFYGRFIEFGKSGAPAQAFLRPAYEAKKTAAAEAVDIVLQQQIAEAVGG